MQFTSATHSQFKVIENELSYLTKAQIACLLASLDESNNPHVKLITTVCLATGARWSEAEELTINSVTAGVIQFSRTKSGKVRAIPINRDLRDKLVAHHKNHNLGDRIFATAFSAFRKGIERAGTHTSSRATHSLERPHVSEDTRTLLK